MDTNKGESKPAPVTQPPCSGRESLIKIEDVWFRYDEEYVLRSASLEIYRGDYLGVIGPNGSSKSTLLKLVLGMLKPQKGEVVLFDQPQRRFKDWHRIGYVAQKANAFNTSFPATVFEVVAANLYSQVGLFKPIGRSARKKVQAALEVVGMADYASRLIGHLSGGQQQKVFIARALVSNPEILFLDEPTVGIDAKSQIEFYELLERLNKSHGMTIVMVSHDIGVITDKVSRIACLADASIVSHDACCAVPVMEFLNDVYGDHMKLMVHHHHHPREAQGGVQLQEEVLDIGVDHRNAQL